MVSGACRRMYCGTRDEARCALAQNQSHEANHPLSHHHLSHYHLSHHHLRRSNVNMDDIRGSYNKMKKKIKHRLAGRKRKPDGTDPGEERADSTSSLPQPEPHIVAGEQQEPHVVVSESYNREGGGANVAGERVFSTDRPLQPDGPESTPARGSDNGQEGGEVDIDEGEINQGHSQPHSDVDPAMGSGRSGEAERVYPSSSTPSIPHSGEPDSM